VEDKAKRAVHVGAGGVKRPVSLKKLQGFQLVVCVNYAKVCVSEVAARVGSDLRGHVQRHELSLVARIGLG